MPFTHANVLQIDATAIIGLFFFLLAFHSFLSPVDEEEIMKYLIELEDAEVNNMKFTNLMNNYCRAQNRDIAEYYGVPSHNLEEWCLEWDKELFEAYEQYSALTYWGSLRGYNDASGQPTQFLKSIRTAPATVSTINFIMIIPFVTSAIIESMFAYKRKDEEASKPGIIIMAAGFFILVGGILFVMLMYTFGLSPTILDSDYDLVPDTREATVGSDPLLADSDGDGLSDWDELEVYLTDPTSADSDLDGLSDWDEINTYSTDPFNKDSDGDGIIDSKEIEKP